MARVDARERNTGWKRVLAEHANQGRARKHLQGASRDEAASHQSHTDRCRGGAMVWTTQRDQALDASVSAVMLHIVSGHDAALGVPDDVEPLQTGSGADSFELVGYRCGEIGDRVGVESPQQAAEIEAEDAVALSPKSLFHDLPDVPSLEEAVKQ